MGKTCDVLIVGAGPAGLMAAIPCAEAGLRTLVLDGKASIGAKLLMSGGGRCNVTNLKVSETDYQTGESRTVRNILRAFPVERTIEFFKQWDVGMVLEESSKYFPEAQSAKVVLEALTRAAAEAGVVVEKGQKVEKVAFEKDLFRVSGVDFEYSSRALVLATGGLSYPVTGSDGSGYLLAKSLGHSIVPTTPALVPLTTKDLDWKGLAGITLPVELTIVAEGKRAARSEGALLFTHIGFSGPAVLDISGPWIRCSSKHKVLEVNFIPARHETALSAELARWAELYADRSWKRTLAPYFPERLSEVLLRKFGIDPRTRLDQIAKKEREAFVRFLFHCPVPVTGAQGYEKAEATAGGVDLKEVNAKTLESKICPGLFFAGEVLDVDGRIGGFNFQWAWASGTVVGREIGRHFQRHQA